MIYVIKVFYRPEVPVTTVVCYQCFLPYSGVCYQRCLVSTLSLIIACCHYKAMAGSQYAAIQCGLSPNSAHQPRLLVSKYLSSTHQAHSDYPRVSDPVMLPKIPPLSPNPLNKNLYLVFTLCGAWGNPNVGTRDCEHFEQTQVFVVRLEGG